MNIILNGEYPTKTIFIPIKSKTFTHTFEGYKYSVTFFSAKNLYCTIIEDEEGNTVDEDVPVFHKIWPEIEKEYDKYIKESINIVNKIWVRYNDLELGEYRERKFDSWQEFKKFLVTNSVNIVEIL